LKREEMSSKWGICLNSLKKNREVIFLKLIFFSMREFFLKLILHYEEQEIG
jgi:hypothetical protein